MECIIVTLIGIAIFFFGIYVIFFFSPFRKKETIKKEKGPSILLNAEEAATKTELIRKKRDEDYLIMLKKEVIEGISKSINRGENKFLLYAVNSYCSDAPIQYTHGKNHADTIIKWLVKEYNYTTIETHDDTFYSDGRTNTSHKIYIVWN